MTRSNLRRFSSWPLAAGLLLTIACSQPTPEAEPGAPEAEAAAEAAATWIVFSSSRSGNGDLWAIQPETGELQRVTLHEEADYAPQYAAAARRLLFASERTDPVALFAMPDAEADIDAAAERLYDNPAGEEVPRYSADGSEVVYVSVQSGNSDIYVAPLDGLTPDFSIAERLTDLPSIEKQPRFSPDGRSIVYVSDLEGQQDLFVLDRDAGTTRNVTNHPALEGHPEWSPDSKTLLFYRFEDGDADLYTIAADGTGAAVNVTQSEGNELVGRFSPDGQQIAFGSARTGDWELFLMQADGTNVRQLTEMEGFDGDPVFMPVVW